MRSHRGRAGAAVGSVSDTGCPVVHGRAFDPLDPVVSEDPYPWLHAAHRDAPVFYMPGHDAWCVTRYDDVLEVLRDTETYSSRNVIRIERLDAEVEGMFPAGALDGGLVTTDPPVHTRLRKLAQKGFSPSLVASRADDVRAVCDRLVDGFVARGRCDLVADFSDQLPAQVITLLIGAPVDRTPDFVRWAHDRIAMLSGGRRMDAETRLEASRRLLEFSRWLHEFVEERRANPQDDLTSGLAHATTDDDEPALTTAEIVSMIGAILAAGTSTTARFIPILMWELLQRPQLWERVRRDPEALTRAVEEGLRYRTTVLGVTRTTTREAVVGGVKIPAGSDLYVCYGGAQRDASTFAEPDEFDIDRPDLAKQIAFGKWRHMCLGAPLARLEIRTAVECLGRRLPGLRLSEGQPLEWIPHMLTPGLSSLLVEWPAAQASS